MTHRSRLMSLAAAAKKHGAIDHLLRYNPVVRARAFRVINAFERADEAGRQRLTDFLTARVLDHARRTRYGSGRGGFESWPVLSNAMLRGAPDAFANAGMLRVPAATGGTSGVPLKLWRSPACVAAEQAFLDHMIEARGLTWATARVASLRPHATKSTSDWSPPFGIETHRGRRLILSSPHLTAETLSWFLEKLAEFNPEILWMTPTMGANLLHLLQGAGLKFPLSSPVILASSARMEPALRAALEREWGASIFDYYGQAERACFAVGARAGEFWFNPAYGRVDLVPSDNDEIVNGRRHVSIIATGFWNSAMPLVRYDTGDRAIVSAATTPCDLRAIALGVRPFLGVAGRSDEYLVAPGGMHIGGLNCIPWEVGHLLQAQIVQQGSDVVIRALVEPAFGPIDRARLEANARAKIPGSMTIRVDVVDRLQTSPHGKTPFVIRNAVPARFHLAAVAEAAD